MNKQKYYVKLIDEEQGYLNSFMGVLEPSHLCLSVKNKSNGNFKAQFTEEEIKTIDERYMAFAEPVAEIEVGK